MYIFATAYEQLFELWCNGNTADFGSVVLGSSPGSSTEKRSSDLFFLFYDWYCYAITTIAIHLFLSKLKICFAIVVPSAMDYQSSITFELPEFRRVTSSAIHAPNYFNLDKKRSRSTIKRE